MKIIFVYKQIGKWQSTAKQGKAGKMEKANGGREVMKLDKLTD